MKKFLGILAIAGVLVACNNAADAEKATKDSLDSVEKATKAAAEATSDKTKDSVENTIEAQKDVVDSLHKDSANH